MMVSMAMAVFPGLTVSDDQFPLTFSDGNHGVNGLDSCLERLVNGFSLQYTGGPEIQ